VPLAEQFVSFPIMAFANHIDKCRYVRQCVEETFIQTGCRADHNNPNNHYSPYIDYMSHFSYFAHVIRS
jgi:hypothetical protein